MKIVKGQVAVITGGASGIGYGLAEALAARGQRIVLSDVREDGRNEAVARLGAGDGTPAHRHTGTPAPG